MTTVKGTTLTPDGARLLRAARDQIVAHPEQFSMGTWDCRTRACIAGHVARAMGAPIRLGPMDVVRAGVRRVVERLGFGACACAEETCVVPDELLKLFGNFGTHDTAELARDAINKFLWDYGYPPSEVAGALATPVDAEDWNPAPSRC